MTCHSTSSSFRRLSLPRNAWENVSAEYARLSNDKMRLKDVQPLLSGIDLKKRSRDDVVRQVVMALHHNVRYTGVEFGEASLIPQYPSET